ncbi:MAG: DUF2207 domain-containing protein, partial [Spirochaetales bacterium]|nr:DUF2207 domain-containing protein [Spirochaetales bacterium]
MNFNFILKIKSSYKIYGSIIFVILLPLIFFCFTVSISGNNYQSSNEERILFFSSAITISENGQIIIHETIVVESLNIEINHGIYRDLPLYENTNSFLPKSLGLNIIEGKMDGNPAIAKREKKNGYLRIYLGDPNSYIDKGIHTFEISYSYDSIIKRLNDEELLYLNITGNNWNFPILKSTATIVFPKNIILNSDFSFTTIEAYTGSMGEKTKNYTFNYIFTTDSKKADTLLFETTDILNKFEGLTVYIKWKPISFISPENQEIDKTKMIFHQIKSFYNTNFPAFILFFGVLLIFLYYLVAWTFVGRDPKKMKVPPSTNIIEQLSPSALRYIWKMGFDTQCLSTA